MTDLAADVQALAQAYLILTEQHPQPHLAERLACRKVLRECRLAHYYDGPSDRRMLIGMLRDVAPALAEEEQQRRRASFDAVEFKRLFG